MDGFKVEWLDSCPAPLAGWLQSFIKSELHSLEDIRTELDSRISQMKALGMVIQSKATKASITMQKTDNPPPLPSTRRLVSKTTSSKESMMHKGDQDSMHMEEMQESPMETKSSLALNDPVLDRPVISAGSRKLPTKVGSTPLGERKKLEPTAPAEQTSPTASSLVKKKVVTSFKSADFPLMSSSEAKLDSAYVSSGIQPKPVGGSSQDFKIAREGDHASAPASGAIKLHGPSFPSTPDVSTQSTSDSKADLPPPLPSTRRVPGPRTKVSDEAEKKATLDPLRSTPGAAKRKLSDRLKTLKESPARSLELLRPVQEEESFSSPPPLPAIRDTTASRLAGDVPPKPKPLSKFSALKAAVETGAIDIR
jgi:hypothetical protein